MLLFLINPATIDTPKHSDGAFMIAPWLCDNEPYRKQQEELLRQGAFSILDNGAFEGAPLKQEDLTDIMEALPRYPDVLVLQDNLDCDAKESKARAIEHYGHLRTQFENIPFELMYVPHVRPKEGVQGLMGLLDWAHDPSQSWISWIGIPRATVNNAYSPYTQTEEQEVNRLVFVNDMMQVMPHLLITEKRKKWHFLGMGADINLIRHFWFVDSMDTASLTWASMLQQTQHPNHLGRLRGHITEVLRGLPKRLPDYVTTKCACNFSILDVLVEEVRRNMRLAEQTRLRRRKD